MREEQKANGAKDNDVDDSDKDSDKDGEGGNDSSGKEGNCDDSNMEVKSSGDVDNKKKLLNYVFDSVPSVSLLSHEEEERLAITSLAINDGKYCDTRDDKKVTPDKEVETKNEDNNTDGKSDVDGKGVVEGKEDNNDASEVDKPTTTATTDDANMADNNNIPIEKVRWMYEVAEEGWMMYSNEASRELEQACRDNKVTHTITIGNDVHTIKLDSKRYTRSNADGEFKIRRHILGDGLSGLWEVLTMKYEKPSGLYGIGILKILEKVWSKKETMSGQQCGLGFMFLYNLYTGESRCKVAGGGGLNDFKGIGPQMNPMFMFGGKKLNGGGGSSSNDSHRFALLLTQLYTDKHIKSLPASVLNILGRYIYIPTYYCSPIKYIYCTLIMRILNIFIIILQICCI